MKTVILRIWSIWFYFLFLGFFILVFPLFLLTLSFKKTWTHNIAHRLNMIWGYFITLPTGVIIKSYHKERLDPDQVYIFAPIHSSYLDIPVCNVSIPNQFRFMGKAELDDIPLFGWMFSRLHISVRRQSTVGAYRSFIRAKEKLEEGVSVLVFPEGTVPDRRRIPLGRFKDGAFRLAIENKVPLVPVSIIGTDRAMRDDGKFLLRPTTIKVIFHEPIQTENLSLEDLQGIKKEVFDLIHVTVYGNDVTQK